MKDLIFTIIIILVVGASAFTAGIEHGRQQREKELERVMKASIMYKKEHKQYHIEQPIQEYRKIDVGSVES